MNKDVLIALLETLKFQTELGVDDVVDYQASAKNNFKHFEALTPKLAAILDSNHSNSKDASLKDDLSSIPPQPAPNRTPKLAIQEIDKTTQAKVIGASSLEDLQKLVESFDACPLKLTATHTVFRDGHPEAPVMLIGEAPGAEEDKQGKPFVGMSGQLLDRVLASVGLSREKNVYISNIVAWRPPGNRPPTHQEIALCLPFIQRHIELIKPKILVLLGATATKSLLQTNEGIMKIRGQWFEYETPFMHHKTQAMATFHPAFLLRSPGQKKFVWQDFLKISHALKKITLNKI